jgi:hypothetical protein
MNPSIDKKVKVIEPLMPLGPRGMAIMRAKDPEWIHRKATMIKEFSLDYSEVVH